MIKDPQDSFREVESMRVQFELDGLKRHASEVLTEKIKAEQTIARLEAEIVRLGGETRSYRESIRREVDRAKQELGFPRFHGHSPKVARSFSN